jgi:hypothetical protein
MTMQWHGSMSRQAEDNAAWVAGELTGCRFHDARLPWLGSGLAPQGLTRELLEPLTLEP